jgi:hypothetical protein
MHVELWMLADQNSRGSGVVEVDVRQQEVVDVAQLEAALGERAL